MAELHPTNNIQADRDELCKQELEYDMHRELEKNMMYFIILHWWIHLSLQFLHVCLELWFADHFEWKVVKASPMTTPLMISPCLAVLFSPLLGPSLV